MYTQGAKEDTTHTAQVGGREGKIPGCIVTHSAHKVPLHAQVFEFLI